MLSYLRATTEYTINPKDRAYSLLGTDHHAQLAQFQGQWVAEKKQGNTITGTPDILEPDEEIAGHYILTDYKTYGSFRVAKCLGLVKETGKSTTEVYKKSGKWGKVGEPKTITWFRKDPNAVDLHDEMLQLNHYRLLLEEEGFHISRMQLQITVRDGGIQMAQSRGVDENIYLVDVPFMMDSVVTTFFETAKKKLEAYIAGTIPLMPCNAEESWNLRRCQDYCEVASNCEQGRESFQRGNVVTVTTLTMGSWGEIKTCKTTLGLTFPTPWVLFNFDLSFARAYNRLSLLQPGKTLVEVPMGTPLTPTILGSADMIIKNLSVTN